MKLQARMIFRGSGKGDGLIIATAAKGQTFLKKTLFTKLLKF